MDYAQIIKEKFPQDERNGLYKVPSLPAMTLGRVLQRDSRIASPADVLAFHETGGMFGSSILIFTRDACYYGKGSFLLEDIKEFQHKDDDCTVFANQNGQLIPHRFSVRNEQVALSLKRVFESIIYTDPKAEKMLEKVYEGYSNTELNWLNLRDEVLRTIDLLYDRYNDGKLSLMDYEAKKEELLKRL